ncbi:MAG: peptidoglycan-binding protein, partial [Actinobacteria bacterium]|nr:peptidoglycan-binding protein [Actinomycetota bacterium]
ANANAAAPINAAASANIGTVDSSATALSEQNVEIDQGIQGDATAVGQQDSGITQQSG